MGLCLNAISEIVNLLAGVYSMWISLIIMRPF